MVPFLLKTLASADTQIPHDSGYIGILEKKMETTTMGLLYRV